MKLPKPSITPSVHHSRRLPIITKPGLTCFTHRSIPTWPKKTQHHTSTNHDSASLPSPQKTLAAGFGACCLDDPDGQCASPREFGSTGRDAPTKVYAVLQEASVQISSQSMGSCQGIRAVHASSKITHQGDAISGSLHAATLASPSQFVSKCR